jgi:hypothetical protein
MVLNQTVLENPLMATYALHAESKNEDRVAHERNLAQINADLRALYDVSPRLYGHAVKYTLKPTTTRLHKLTEAAIGLALDIGQEV